MPRKHKIGIKQKQIGQWVWAQKPELELLEINHIINLMLQYIKEALAKSTKVQLDYFGVFKVVLRKGGKAVRNPRVPGSKMIMPTRCIVKFTPQKEFAYNTRKLLEDL